MHHLGPLPKTTIDFWRLVWQEKPQSIVMVANLEEGNKTKCHQYWPDTGTKSFGPFQVTITDQQILADYTTRSLLMQVQLLFFISITYDMKNIPSVNRKFKNCHESDSVSLHSLA